MLKLILPLTLALAAQPALAAGDKPFFSLANTDFVVLIGFLLFIAVLVYFKIPGTLGGMLDSRSESIRNELDEARKLREDAQTLLASYERKQREVKEQADRIVAQAREEANLAAQQAKADLQKSIERRLATAEDQIASAQASAVKDVRDRAIVVAIGAARDIVAKQMTKQDVSGTIDDAIVEVGKRLH